MSNASRLSEQPNRKLLNYSQTAAHLGLSWYAVYQMVHRGQLPTIAVGTRKKIPLIAIDAMLQSAAETARAAV